MEYEPILAKHMIDLLLILLCAMLIFVALVKWKRIVIRPRFVIVGLLIFGTVIFNSILRIVNDIRSVSP